MSVFPCRCVSCAVMFGTVPSITAQDTHRQGNTLFNVLISVKSFKV